MESLPMATEAQIIANRHNAQKSTGPAESAPDLTLGRLAVKDFSNKRILERLLIYERRIENSLYKTHLEFQRIKLIKKMNQDT
jgi:hypothetical protein